MSRVRDNALLRRRRQQTGQLEEKTGTASSRCRFRECNLITAPLSETNADRSPEGLYLFEVRRIFADFVSKSYTNILAY